MCASGKLRTTDYLRSIGVRELGPLTSPFDPGYDSVTLEGHLEQSHHLICILKISMACWMVANETVTRRKIATARNYNLPTVSGVSPFEIRVAPSRLASTVECAAARHD